MRYSTIITVGLLATTANVARAAGQRGSASTCAFTFPQNPCQSPINLGLMNSLLGVAMGQVRHHLQSCKGNMPAGHGIPPPPFDNAYLTSLTKNMNDPAAVKLILQLSQKMFGLVQYAQKYCEVDLDGVMCVQQALLTLADRQLACCFASGRQQPIASSPAYSVESPGEEASKYVAPPTDNVVYVEEECDQYGVPLRNKQPIDSAPARGGAYSVEPPSDTDAVEYVEEECDEDGVPLRLKQSAGGAYSTGVAPHANTQYSDEDPLRHARQYPGPDCDGSGCPSQNTAHTVNTPCKGYGCPSQNAARGAAGAGCNGSGCPSQNAAKGASGAGCDGSGCPSKNAAIGAPGAGCNGSGCPSQNEAVSAGAGCDGTSCPSKKAAYTANTPCEGYGCPSQNAARGAAGADCDGADGECASTMAAKAKGLGGMFGPDGTMHTNSLAGARKGKSGAATDDRNDDSSSDDAIRLDAKGEPAFGEDKHNDDKGDTDNDKQVNDDTNDGNLEEELFNGDPDNSRATLTALPSTFFTSMLLFVVSSWLLI